MVDRILPRPAMTFDDWAYIGTMSIQSAAHRERLRVMVETDAGGDPDDEQSLVRFLLMANEWDVEGILCNRPRARNGENRNPERTGLGIVQRLVDAYGRCHANLVLHDPRFPSPDRLRGLVVDGTASREFGVRRILEAVDSRDRRPLWFMNWGTDHGSDPSNLLRALDQVRAQRGEAGYARFKRRIRLSSDDKFGDHAARIKPPFPLWVDTLRPAKDGRRWYHRFSPITAEAGGFSLRRDVLTGHGPLGELYPVNTHLPQKEGDTMMFLYSAPTGMNDPEQPHWGSWAGRYVRRPEFPGMPYYWADGADTWQGTTHRDNGLARFAADLQNDFRARLDWCVRPFAEANHPPVVDVAGGRFRRVRSGDRVVLDARGTRDPDGDGLQFQWWFHPEATDFDGMLPRLAPENDPVVSFRAPDVKACRELHIVLTVRDDGDPPLARYARVVLTIDPRR